MVQIDNKDKKFPVSGKVFIFAKGVTADDLGKWVNNQHSDALFPDIPEPIATHALPSDSMKTASGKRIGQEKGGFRVDIYDKYTVEFGASETDLGKKLKLNAFKDTAWST